MLSFIAKNQTKVSKTMWVVVAIILGCYFFENNPLLTGIAIITRYICVFLMVVYICALFFNSTNLKIINYDVREKLFKASIVCSAVYIIGNAFNLEIVFYIGMASLIAVIFYPLIMLKRQK
ncbi:hypothetical protein [Mycoplasma sp. P36-A1]|uniref:hypothetical protein n=1 Tax=Mycoplasma sp. P36-A1 TaxID=3252900 RepID=UPI003C2D862F